MKLRLLILFSFSLLIVCAQPSLARGTTAGVEITSEVEASSGGTPIVVLTDSVYVTQAYGLELGAGSTSATLPAGSSFYSSHTITNVGNGSDTIHFSLSSTTADFNSTLIRDDNHDTFRSTDEVTPVPTQIILAEDANYYLFVVLTSPLNGAEGLAGQTLFTAEGTVIDGAPYVGSNGVAYGGYDTLDSLVKLGISVSHDTTPPTISEVLIKGKKRFANDIISPSFEAEATILDDITENIDRIRLRLFSNDNNQNVIDVTNQVGEPEPEGCYYDTISGKFKYVSSIDLSAGSYDFILEAWDKSNNNAAESITPLYVKDPDKVEMIGPVLNHPNPFAPLKGQITNIAYGLTTDATITLYLFNLRGSTVYKRTYPAGTEGGAAGYNEIPFSGFSDFGEVLGNGVYLFQIIHKNKVIGKGKLTIFDAR